MPAPMPRPLRRHENRWSRWEEAIEAGKTPEEILPFLEDETIIELLASGNPERRRYELNILATELTNRLVRFRRLVDQASRHTQDSLGEALGAAERADEATHGSARRIEHHIEVRQDQVEDEPVLARRAAREARETRNALDDLQRATGDLARARGEIGRHAREIDEE